jgi:hypothetical protein
MNKTQPAKPGAIIRGHVHRYDVFVASDVVTVIDETGFVAKQQVKGLSAFVAGAKAFRLGWGQFPAFEVIYLYDKGDGNFGYGLNLHVAWFSEWGYAPF